MNLETISFAVRLEAGKVLTKAQSSICHISPDDQCAVEVSVSQSAASVQTEIYLQPLNCSSESRQDNLQKDPFLSIPVTFRKSRGATRLHQFI